MPQQKSARFLPAIGLKRRIFLHAGEIQTFQTPFRGRFMGKLLNFFCWTDPCRHFSCDFSQMHDTDAVQCISLYSCV